MRYTFADLQSCFLFLFLGYRKDEAPLFPRCLELLMREAHSIFILTSCIIRFYMQAN